MGHYFLDEELKLAAILHTRFKQSWLSDEEKEAAENLLREEYKILRGSAPSDSPPRYLIDQSNAVSVLFSVSIFLDLQEYLHYLTTVPTLVLHLPQRKKGFLCHSKNSRAA